MNKNYAFALVLVLSVGFLAAHTLTLGALALFLPFAASLFKIGSGALRHDRTAGQ